MKANHSIRILAVLLAVAPLGAQESRPATTTTTSAPTTSAAAERRAHVFVSGVVQGVGFRNWTQSTARGLKLAGWVMNRDDGRVEAVIQGPREQVGQMLERMKRGPTSAKVDKLEIKDEPIAEMKVFEIRTAN